ncbi:MAG: WYL domain-containing protein [Chitinophagales bacterium]
MPINRNALIRFRTIDKCLQNRFRKWSLDDLIDACSEALYEYEGIDKGVSKRTVQGDIQLMRSNKLGYNAPIIVTDKKHYTYEDPDYSITNIPLTDQDLNKLTEVADILKQFSGFTYFQDISDMVSKLEDKINSAKKHQPAIIDFERNDNLKGLEHLDVIYQHIQQKKALLITYQSFKARKPDQFNFHAFLLKEFRNRWFVLGKREKNLKANILALDRMISLETSTLPYVPHKTDISNYFKDVIGVTVSENSPVVEVQLWIHSSNAPYVLTKPMHTSQKLLKKTPDGIIISITVQQNFELEREILGFGECIKVLSPKSLADRIQIKIEKANSLYQ